MQGHEARVGRGRGRLGAFSALALALALPALLALLAPREALAQSPGPNAAGIPVGAFTFRPHLDVRLRGEYRHAPVDTGGLVYESTAVLADAPGSAAPTVVSTQPAVMDQVVLAERARLGLAVDRGPVTAALTLQDARVFGTFVGLPAGPGEPPLPSLAPVDAYVDVHKERGRRLFFRIGRQRVTWGDGRLLSENDWSETARPLDAARLGFQVADFDFEVLAAVLAPPGSLPPSAVNARAPVQDGPGAQLYGLDAVWHLFPLLSAELTALARIVREPAPRALTSSDVFVGSARIFGEKKALSYALEGAYELGRTATASAGDGERRLSALALAARGALETPLPFRATFGLVASYASGDDGADPTRTTRFDPILPDERRHHGLARLTAWSNLMEVGGSALLRPSERSSFELAYRYAALAERQDRWTTAALQPVGAAPDSENASLGHEANAIFVTTPWDAVELEAGYAAFFFGDGARAILEAARRASGDVHHYAYLQARVRAP